MKVVSVAEHGQAAAAETIVATRHGRYRSIIKAFLRIDIIDDISYPLPFLIQQLTVLIPIVSTFFIGQLADGSPRSADFGGDYFTFALVGLSSVAVMQGALSGFGVALQRAQERGNLETLFVEPVPWAGLPYLMNIWRALLAVANGAVLLGLGWLLGAEYRASGFPAFASLLLLGVLSSQAVGVVASAFLILAKKSRPLVLLYGLAASIFAGSVFSVTQLPPWLQVFSWAVPHTYVVNAARAQLMMEPTTFTIPYTTALIYLVAFNAIVLGLGTWMFHRSVQYARKMGMLSGY